MWPEPAVAGERATYVKMAVDPCLLAKKAPEVQQVVSDMLSSARCICCLMGKVKQYPTSSGGAGPESKVE
jgi:hypothetical protein